MANVKFDVHTKLITYSEADGLLKITNLTFTPLDEEAKALQPEEQRKAAWRQVAREHLSSASSSSTDCIEESAKLADLIRNAKA